MKYFVVSDVHSCFTPMVKALKDVGFDETNPNHTLISCGDNFDRGLETNKMYQYLKSLARKILIKGNHEDLFIECIERGCLNEAIDYYNGTANSIIQFAKSDSSHYTYSDMLMDASLFGSTEINDLMSEIAHIKNKKTEILDFMKAMPYFFETKKYIFTHASVPFLNQGTEKWRTATDEEWVRATWENPSILKKSTLGKIVVCGHFDTDLLRRELDIELGFSPNPKPNYSILKTDFLIGLDTCTIQTKKCNVFVFEE